MEAVLLDPQSEYAEHFIELLWQRYGIKTVALHRSWRGRVMGASGHPVLNSPAVSANYMIGSRSMDEVAGMLAERHHIEAVVPHHELTVIPLHSLAVRLGLSWAQPDVIPMFRDKAKLKAHIRGIAPNLRMNASRLVRDAAEVRAFAAEFEASRVVLKPRDGAGNMNVAFVTADAPDATLDAYFARSPGEALAEEFIGGEEYYVNGQADAQGNAEILAIGRYVRVPHLGRENVEVGTRVLHTTDSEFRILAEYAGAVMAATGLRRSPFHLEAKIDDRGPCLIEVGARLCGGSTAFQDMRLHNGVDPLDLALQHYLYDSGVAPAALDWTAYDSVHGGTAMGLAPRDERISVLIGMDEVAAMPEFVTWLDKPVVGKKVRRTIDLTTSPWMAELAAPTADKLENACIRAQELVSWNPEPDSRLAQVPGMAAYAASKFRAVAGGPREFARTERGWRR